LSFTSKHQLSRARGAPFWFGSGWRREVSLLLVAKRRRVKRRVGNNSHESGLREWTSCPSLARFSAKPDVCLHVAIMGRPHQCDQHVHVQQEGGSFLVRVQLPDFFRVHAGRFRRQIEDLYSVDQTRGTRNRKRAASSSDTALPKASERLAV
jgi:hypothetical protein